MHDEYIRNINTLIDKMTELENEISTQVETIKEHYLKASQSLKENQTYFLSGIQTSSIAKSYLLTNQGIQVLGEETLPIPVFIDSIIKFANYPKRKIEVLKDLAEHLQKVNIMINEK